MKKIRPVVQQQRIEENLIDYLCIMDAEKIKISILKQLKEYGVFWSYKDIGDTIPDDSLIENTLIFLDLEQINQLFEIFPKEYVKKVWKNNILVQEPRYHNLNKFLSWFYFNE